MFFTKKYINSEFILVLRWPNYRFKQVLEHVEICYKVILFNHIFLKSSLFEKKLSLKFLYFDNFLTIVLTSEGTSNHHFS